MSSRREPELIVYGEDAPPVMRDMAFAWSASEKLSGGRLVFGLALRPVFAAHWLMHACDLVDGPDSVPRPHNWRSGTAIPLFGFRGVEHWRDGSATLLTPANFAMARLLQAAREASDDD